MNQRLKRAVVFGSLLLVLARVGPSSAQSGGELALSPAPYRTGERLTFNVSFSNLISAAHVELQVVARGIFFGREGIQLRGHVETSGLVNAALLSINNEYVTYVDPQTGLPFHAQQIAREATRLSDTARDFNLASGVATLPSKSKTGESSGTYDLLSAIYGLRALPLNDGSTYYFSVKGENEDYQAELRVSGRQTIKTNAGSFNAISSQIRINNNSSADNYRIRIFFSDDERHIPVLVTARVASGEIRAELAGSEILKPGAPTPATDPTTIPIAPVAQPVIGATRPAGDAGDRNLDSLPFKVGEQLNYQVFLGDVPQAAGTATFQVRASSRYFDRDGLLFVARAQTINAAQRLFFASDQISSYVDPKTLLPFRSEMNLIEGSRRLNQTLTINQDHGTATGDKGERIEIPVGTHDYISFYYLARTFNLVPPKRNAVSILVNNKPRTLFITALKREAIQLGSQSIPAIQLSLTTDDPQGDRYLVRAWVSEDKRRLPLRLTATTALGPLRADLAIIPVTPQ